MSGEGAGGWGEDGAVVDCVGDDDSCQEKANSSSMQGQLKLLTSHLYPTRPQPAGQQGQLKLLPSHLYPTHPQPAEQQGQLKLLAAHLYPIHPRPAGQQSDYGNIYCECACQECAGLVTRCQNLQELHTHAFGENLKGEDECLADIFVLKPDSSKVCHTQTCVLHKWRVFSTLAWHGG